MKNAESTMLETPNTPTIRKIEISVSYPTPYGDLCVTQENSLVYLGNNFIHIEAFENETQRAEISWVSIQQNGLTMLQALDDFQKSIAYWSHTPKLDLLKGGALPEINAYAIMNSAYPEILASVEEIKKTLLDMKKENAKEAEKINIIKSFPHNTLLLDTGVVPDFDEKSKREDTNCVCLLRLINQDDKFTVERADGKPLPHYGEDPVFLALNAHPATSSAAKRLLSNLDKPARTKVLFSKKTDFDKKEAIIADKILLNAQKNNSIAERSVDIKMISIEEWLSGISIDAI